MHSSWLAVPCICMEQQMRYVHWDSRLFLAMLWNCFPCKGPHDHCWTTMHDSIISGSGTTASGASKITSCRAMQGTKPSEHHEKISLIQAEVLLDCQQGIQVIILLFHLGGRCLHNRSERCRKGLPTKLQLDQRAAFDGTHMQLSLQSPQEEVVPSVVACISLRHQQAHLLAAQ